MKNGRKTDRKKVIARKNERDRKKKERNKKE